MKTRFAAIILLSLFLLSSCGGAFFYPSSETFIDPTQFGLHPQKVSFNSGDGTPLSGWFFKARTKKPLGTVVQFHGNAENMTSHFRSLVWLIAHGYHLFTFDYRGYGLSEGKPDIAGVNADGVAAIRHIMQMKESAGTPIILYGQSLGGIILLRSMAEISERSRISHVIVEGAFLSYQEIAREKMSDIWLIWPIQHLAYVLFSDNFAASKSVKSLSPVPLLVIHGRNDPIIPFRFGEEIFQAAEEPKLFWAIENGEHIDAMMRHGGRYRRQLLEYLQSEE